MLGITPCTNKNYNGVICPADVRCKTERREKKDLKTMSIIVSPHTHTTPPKKLLIRCSVVGTLTSQGNNNISNQRGNVKRLHSWSADGFTWEKWQIKTKAERNVGLYLVRRDWQEQSNGSQHCSWQHIRISPGQTPRCSQFVGLLHRGLTNLAFSWQLWNVKCNLAGNHSRYLHRDSRESL